MTVALDQSRTRRNPALALRFAARELRGGLRGFYVFIACIALGVMAIAGIGSVADGLADGLAREGRVILGGDLAFSLSLREASADERAFLADRGRYRSPPPCAPWRARDDGRSALVEVKAVDAAYPLYGEVALDPPQPLATLLAQRDGAYGAAADPALLARLDLKPGARIMVGAAAIEIRAALTSEPDKLAGGIGFGPRLLISEAALRATGLLQPGSVVRWHYRLRLPDNDATDTGVRAVTAAAQAQLPEAGWEVRSRSNASPALERNVERFTQYLTLVGLTALLVGGVGVANAVKGHLDRRRDVDRHAQGAGRDRLARVRDLSRPRCWCSPRSARCRASRSAPPCRFSSPGASAPCCHCRSRRRCIRVSLRWRCSTGF